MVFMNCQMRREDIILHHADISSIRRRGYLDFMGGVATAIRERYLLNPSDWQICDCRYRIPADCRHEESIASGAIKLHFLDNLDAYYKSLTSSPVLQHQRYSRWHAYTASLTANSRFMQARYVASIIYAYHSSLHGTGSCIINREVATS